MMMIRACLAFTAVLAAQDTSSTRTYTVDAMGNRIAGAEVSTSSSKTASDTTFTRMSINHEMVPAERVEERVVRDDASGKVVERIIQRYDDSGRPQSRERVVIEETKAADGSSTVSTTKYRSDINGQMSVAERAVTRTQMNGDSKTTDTVVERPAMNSSMETVEKRTTVAVKQGNGFEESEVTYRRGAQGGFFEATRQVTNHTESDGRSTDNVAKYEVGPAGQLELHGQTVTRTVKQPDGSLSSEVDIFGKFVPGIYNAGGGLQLKEHQTVERRAEGGAVVERVNVQRPTVSDPRRLGAPQAISETVCRGKCDSGR